MHPDRLRTAVPTVQLVVEAEDHNDLAAVTEAGLRSWLRRQGWRTARIPGHAANAPGPDLIAYRRDPRSQRLVMRILDNKATAATTQQPRRIATATGLSAISLHRNLPRLIAILGRSQNPLDRAAVELLNQVRVRASSAVARAAASAPLAVRDAAVRRATLKLPRGARLVVTTVGGRAPGITPALRRRNVSLIPPSRLEVADVDLRGPR